MSLDLAVFDPAGAPTECVAFLAWYAGQTEGLETQTENDPAVASPPLRRWYDNIRRTFPAKNQRDATGDEDRDRITAYSIRSTLIYAAFRSEHAEEAFKEALKWARPEGLGLFDVSDTGNLWSPINGGYRVQHCAEAKPVL